MTTETIFALSSAPGRAGVAVIRISGPAAGACLMALTDKPLPAPRQAALRVLTDPLTGDKIDHALNLWFAAPHSFTGEDVAELQVHGGKAIVESLLAALSRLPDCRPALPGEFTRRAFENDKLDLTEAEAIADLIDAETTAQRQQALRQLEGSLSALYHGWADKLVRTLAHLEAYLDFPDEPLPPELEAAHEQLVTGLITDISQHLAAGQRGQRLRDGIRIAILGAPNAGKSSLLNALTLRDTAIVSPVAGTTRDVIESALDVGGYPVLFQDTAGLRDSADPVEQEGVRRAASRAAEADLLVLLYDVTVGPDPLLLDYINKQPTVLVANKVDLIEKAPAIQGHQPVGISAAAGPQGIQPLQDYLVNWLHQNYQVTEAPSLTRLRHQLQLEQTLASLQRSLQAPSLDLTAEDLRLAVRQLGAITGKVDIEDMLDIIFRDFCIGK